ncbi:hypothetical protein ABIC11_004562 [Pseudomonas oryzihabitans]
MALAGRAAGMVMRMPGYLRWQVSALLQVLAINATIQADTDENEALQVALGAGVTTE